MISNKQVEIYILYMFNIVQLGHGCIKYVLLVHVLYNQYNCVIARGKTIRSFSFDLPWYVDVTLKIIQTDIIGALCAFCCWRSQMTGDRHCMTLHNGYFLLSRHLKLWGINICGHKVIRDLVNLLLTDVYGLTHLTCCQVFLLTDDFMMKMAFMYIGCCSNV